VGSGIESQQSWWLEFRDFALAKVQHKLSIGHRYAVSLVASLNFTEYYREVNRYASSAQSYAVCDIPCSLPNAA